MKKIIVILMVLTFVSVGCSTGKYDAQLAEGFKQPGNQARPRAYWNWLKSELKVPGTNGTAVLLGRF